MDQQIIFDSITLLIKQLEKEKEKSSLITKQTIIDNKIEGVLLSIEALGFKRADVIEFYNKTYGNK